MNNQLNNMNGFNNGQNNVGKNNNATSNKLNEITQNPNKNINPSQVNNLQNSNNSGNGLDNAKNEVAKKGLETAANAYGGPALGGLTKKALNSKTGNNALNLANKLTKHPVQHVVDFFKNKSEDIASDANVNEETDAEIDDVKTDSAIPKEVKNFLIPVALSGGLGCLGSILGMAVIAAIFLAPILFVISLFNNIADGATSIWNNIVYFFKGCDNEQDCQNKERDSFYDKLEEVHNEYLGEPYFITLNTELIVATLTYYDPQDLMSEEADLESIDATNMVDFKKSEKKIKELAKQMVSTKYVCVDENGITVSDIEKESNCPAGQTKEEAYFVDEDKYRKYLEDTFIRKFYYDNKTDDETNKKVMSTVREIYSRVEAAKYLSGIESKSKNFIANNAEVIITDCNTGAALETVSLYEYLQGVLYAEGYAVKRSEEFLKVQAVISKTYLFKNNGAKPDAIPTTLRIKSCQMNQIYCNVEKGCHNMNDGKNESHNTIATGPNADGEYFRPPLTDVETLKRIKNAIDSTLEEFVIKDNNFVSTQYRSDCAALNLTCDSTTNILDQKVANEMVTSGSTYKEVINYFYSGDIATIKLSSSGYPLDLVHNRITSAFGWRVHPIDKVCRTHGGTDIAAPADANIYSIADGVVVTNVYSSSYGNYTVIGHNPTGSGYQYYSLYAHQIRLSNHIKVGDTVKAGQVIGNVGSTGKSSGNHLHIEIYTMQGNTKIKQDPVTYFTGVNLTGEKWGPLYSNESQCKSCLLSNGAKNC